MSDAIVQIGTQIAADLPSTSEQVAFLPIKTTGDLLAILAGGKSRSLRMLKTTCGHLGTYLNLPGDQIPFDLLCARRKGFRKFLAGRRYSENTIRSYVYQTGVLVRTARKYGWKADADVPEKWRSLLEVAGAKKIADIVRDLSLATKSPAEVTVESVEQWCAAMTQEGMLFTTVAAKRNAFWRLLCDTGWSTFNPPYLIKQSKYGVALDQLAPELEAEIQAVLKWKTAEFAKGRPKWGKIRMITAKGFQLTLTQIAGFAINIYGIQPASLVELIQKDLIEAYVEWAINERGHTGYTLQRRLGTVAALMCNHPAYASFDFNWMRSLIDSIELGDLSDRKQRKAEKYIDYAMLETIPDKIRAERVAYAKKKKKNAKKVARIAMEEFMFRWLLVLPWRQRNIREMRIGGPAPNLFKARIAPFSELDKPTWVVEEEARNSQAEFWQIKFSAKETKTGLAIHLLLPKQLIRPLEEYLTDHRPVLLDGNRTETLLLNMAGKPMRADLVEKAIGHWSLQFSGTRTTPHLFRDSVAYAWLKSHPKDFLTLTKLLWHKRVETTLSIYGARFNESSGVAAMEAWLEQRQTIAA